MRIKNIIIAFTLLLSLAGNAPTPFSDRAPLDSVPEWVKERVTPKEYEIWKTMSSVFYIDYSILKTELSPERKQEIYDGLKKICEGIEKGEFSHQVGTGFTFAKENPIDTTFQWKLCELTQIDENIQLCKREASVYQSAHSNSVELVCTVWYIYNSQKKEVHIVKYEISPNGSRCKFQGGMGMVYQKNLNRLQGSYAGTFRYEIGGRKYCDQLEKSFAFSIDK